MGMTITEKILASHAGKDVVESGEIIDARLDLTLANDITAPLSLEEFDKVGAKKFLILRRLSLFSTTSRRTRTYPRQKTASEYGSSPGNTE